ncbi:two-component regulator propeller domain-containing protein [Puia sp. P3]|uniref:two-component regulator propeller domain-containing protein n=1 Tax=Puia sp. P3 TaxID=3423952 RepID=UPI003D67D00D
MRSSIVTAFAEQPDGNLWVSTDGGGVYSYDRKNDRLQRLPLVVEGGTSSPLLVLALHRTRGNQLYVGAFNKGLLLYDPPTGRARKVSLSDRDEGPVSILFIVSGRIGKGRFGWAPMAPASVY